MNNNFFMSKTVNGEEPDMRIHNTGSDIYAN